MLVMCEEILDLMSPKFREKGIKFIFRFKSGASRFVFGDSGRIRQLIIIINLLSSQ